MDKNVKGMYIQKQFYGTHVYVNYYFVHVNHFEITFQLMKKTI